MNIDKLTRSLIVHESRMEKYDDTPLENGFKSRLCATRDKGRRKSSTIGRGGGIADHSDNRFRIWGEVPPNYSSVKGLDNKWNLDG